MERSLLTEQRGEPWCWDNLLIKITKTKELIVEYRRLQGGGHTPADIEGTEVEMLQVSRN